MACASSPVPCSPRSGSLVVITRNRRIELRPERDGTTTVVSVKAVEFPIGTRIEISFGPAICPSDACTLCLGELTAHRLAHGNDLHRQDVAVVVRRRAIPRAAVRQRQHAGARADRESRRLHRRARPARSSRRQGSVARSARTSPAQQAEKLLEVARANAKPVTPRAARSCGPERSPDFAYACSCGIAEFGSAAPLAEIPFVVEAWARKKEQETRA